ncbi:MAG: AAA family ATPase [Fimbriimonadaceae bacterium]|jgi:predicted ATPase|nr:AAA family ATPase [Fimbriimonadaceae bacterium]
MNRIYLVSGPPAAGKTTLCQELARRLSLVVHIPVDDVRLWVVQGLADSVPWTEETERQFQVAEEAVAAMASTYYHHGFDVLVDHCRNLPRLDQVVKTYWAGLPVVKVCLLPDLEENLHRNATRTNKDFPASVLVETIEGINPAVRANPGQGWLSIDNTSLSAVETADLVLAQPSQIADPRE